MPWENSLRSAVRGALRSLVVCGLVLVCGGLSSGSLNCGIAAVAQEGAGGKGDAPAAAPKPFCVFQVASVERLEKGAEYIAGFFEDRAALEAKYQKLIDQWHHNDGVNRQRPIGMMLFLGESLEEKPWYVVSFPIDDFETFLREFAAKDPSAAPPVKVPGKTGVWEIPEVIPNMKFAIERQDSVFLCEEAVLEKPYDRIMLFDEAAKEDARAFDISFSCRLSEIPQGIKALFGVGMRAAMSEVTNNFPPPSEDESKMSPEVQKLAKSALRITMNGYVALMERLVTDSTQVTLGMKLDTDLEYLEISLPWTVAPNSPSVKMIDNWLITDGRLSKLVSGIPNEERSTYSYAGFKLGKTMSPMGGIVARLVEEGLKSNIEDVEQQKALIKATKPVVEISRSYFNGKPFEFYSEMSVEAASSMEKFTQEKFTQFDGIGIVAYAPRKNFAAEFTSLVETVKDIAPFKKDDIKQIVLNVAKIRGVAVHQIDAYITSVDPSILKLSGEQELKKLPVAKGEDGQPVDGPTKNYKANVAFSFAKADTEEASDSKPEKVLKTFYVSASDDLFWYSNLPLDQTTKRIERLLTRIEGPTDVMAARVRTPFYFSSMNLADLANMMGLKQFMPESMQPIQRAKGALQSSTRMIDDGVVLSYRANQAWIRWMAYGIEKGLNTLDPAELDIDGEKIEVELK